MSARAGASIPVTQQYRKLEVVGKGAYGAVYKGLHISTNTIVALKIIDLDTADDDVADIQREVALLSQLRAENHNITKYYGCWLEGPRVWIVMDFASGGSVRTLAKAMEEGVLEERWMVVIVRETLVALSYLHKSNVIHRDIKPANILVQASGRVVLCDFGVSALLSSSQAKRTTFIGTPHYMAPEVLTSSAYDSKADIWSLGITLYEMATGSQPLAEIPQMQAITLIPKVKPPRLGEQYGSREMREFITYCLRELPSDRLSADELAKMKWIKSSSKVPVGILSDLMNRYDNWANSGGVRQSLAMKAPWELDSSRTTEDDEVSDGSTWEFDTVRARPNSFHWDETAQNESYASTSTSTAQLPQSLRMLFDDDSMTASSSEPFLANQSNQSFQTSTLPSVSSFASLPDLTRGDSDHEGDATARVTRSHQRRRRSPDASAGISTASASDTEAAQSPHSYRDRRGSKTLPDIIIPPPDTRFNQSEGDSPSPTSKLRLTRSPPLSREETKARATRRKASPTDFQFPRSGMQKAVFDRAPSDVTARPPRPALYARPPSVHKPTGSLEYASSSDGPSPTVPGSHSAHPSLSSGTGLMRKPSLSRQMSASVMENGSDPGAQTSTTALLAAPPPLIRGKSAGLLTTKADYEQSAPNPTKPSMSLKDMLKLTPLPIGQTLGADMLPPSPSVLSSGQRQFLPSPSSLGPASSRAPTPSPAAMGYDSQLAFVQSYTAGLMPSGPPIKPLDFNNLMRSREDTHAALARVVDDLSQWLQVVETGLTTLLQSPHPGVIEEEPYEPGSEDSSSVSPEG